MQFTLQPPLYELYVGVSFQPDFGVQKLCQPQKFGCSALLRQTSVSAQTQKHPPHFSGVAKYSKIVFQYF